MEFGNDKPIYLQIADWVVERLLTGVWQEQDRVPSVRELAVSMEVNPNTAVRAFSWLQEQGVLENRRGLGYFVAAGGPERAAQLRRRRMEEEELPGVFRSLRALGVSGEELQDMYRRFCRKEA